MTIRDNVQSLFVDVMQAHTDAKKAYGDYMKAIKDADTAKTNAKTSAGKNTVAELRGVIDSFVSSDSAITTARLLYIDKENVLSEKITLLHDALDLLARNARDVS